MYKHFREKMLRSVYMPCELHDAIEQRAQECFCNFNQMTVQALLAVFLPSTVPLISIEAISGAASSASDDSAKTTTPTIIDHKDEEQTPCLSHTVSNADQS